MFIALWFVHLIVPLSFKKDVVLINKAISVCDFAAWQWSISQVFIMRRERDEWRTAP